jgi:hypothetical protein
LQCRLFDNTFLIRNGYDALIPIIYILVDTNYHHLCWNWIFSILFYYVRQKTFCNTYFALLGCWLNGFLYLLVRWRLKAISIQNQLLLRFHQWHILNILFLLWHFLWFILLYPVGNRTSSKKWRTSNYKNKNH